MGQVLVIHRIIRFQVGSKRFCLRLGETLPREVFPQRKHILRHLFFSGKNTGIVIDRRFPHFQAQAQLILFSLFHQVLYRQAELQSLSFFPDIHRSVLLNEICTVKTSYRILCRSNAVLFCINIKREFSVLRKHRHTVSYGSSFQFLKISMKRIPLFSPYHGIKVGKSGLSHIGIHTTILVHRLIGMEKIKKESDKKNAAQ